MEAEFKGRQVKGARRKSCMFLSGGILSVDSMVQHPLEDQYPSVEKKKGNLEGFPFFPFYEPFSDVETELSEHNHQSSVRVACDVISPVPQIDQWRDQSAVHDPVELTF